MTEERTSEGPSPSPAEMLAITEQQHQRTERALDVSPGLLFGTWGLAWGLGFGELYLTAGPDPVLDVPFRYALSAFLLLIVGAGVVTAWHLAGSLRGLRGPAQRSGAMYGWSWTLGFVALGMMIGAVGRLGISDEVYAMLWTSGSGLLVGTLYLSCGALTRDWLQYGVGAWILLVNAIGAFTGIPHHYLVMSLAGGGGFLLAGVVFALRGRTRSAPFPGKGGVALKGGR
ncbi:hypothetical protein [Actinopolyspora mortivallis]|uniref:Uncharacterized protein n=1 Tax=Actinopolyspora mortivallis TaxID=33906 RepID=A0A2T0GXF1_ACTMO|nr:hypothetical protein [Actinopolyspora mortivallis]PRW63789.1 hypothetical protein CEP50_08365 [Actinopolyspora mortivallis]